MNMLRPYILSAEHIENRSGKLPYGYGIAWWDPSTDTAHCCLIPFHLVIGALRRWSVRASLPARPDVIAKAFQAGWSAGYTEGRNAENNAFIRRGYAGLIKDRE
jgi:hypothetical protein